MNITVMNYNDSDYIIYYEKAVEMLGDIRLQRIKFKHELVDYKGHKVFKVENDGINDLFFQGMFAPEGVYENTNNVIDSINITQEMLAASYSLLKIQLDEINSSKANGEEPNYFWFILYFEDTVNRISTLNDLLWNFINYFNGYDIPENHKMRDKVRKKLKEDDHNDLKALLTKNGFETNDIRNHSIHNTKPFLYKGATTVKDELIAIGQGTRKFNLDEDIVKIDIPITFCILLVIA